MPFFPFALLLPPMPLLRRWPLHATHPSPMGPVDPTPDPEPGRPLPPEPVGPHPTPMPT